MKPNKNLGILLFLLMSMLKTQAQMAGSFSVPASFPTIAAAINSLNLVGVSGPVTIHVNAGHTETATAGGYKLFTVAGASAGNQVFFQKSGAGPNPIIYAYSGGTATPASARQDGVWCLVGADYITIDGIDLYDPNTSNPATMEYGYGMYNANPDNGCQYNTIKNCSVTLTTINNVTGAGPINGGTRGIDIVSASYTANVTYLTYTSSASPHIHNKIYANIIQYCSIGIQLSGISGSAFVCDANDIGGTSAVTGNTVTNFGSSNTAIGSCGIRAIWSTALNVSNNVINNNTGTGPTLTSKIYGIWCNTYSSSTTLVDRNTITLSKTGSNGGEVIGVFGDYMNSNSTLQVTNNTFPSFSFSAGATSSCSVIFNRSSISGTVLFSGNSIRNVTVDIPGRLEVISSTPGNGLCTIAANTIANVSCSVTLLNDIFFSGYTQVISDNLIDSVSTNAVHSGIICDNQSVMSTTISNNILRNIASGNFTACSAVNSALAAKEISNNQIYTIRSLPATTVGLSFVGIDLGGSTTTSTLSGNSVYSVSSTSSGNSATLIGMRVADNSMVSRNKVAGLYSDGTGSIVGIQALSTGDHTLSNNVVGDLHITGSSMPEAISGISIGGYPSSLYYNSVYLNATSTGTSFGSSALTLSGTGTLTSINNIFVNTSTPTGTALTCAIRKASSLNIPLSANSNNNLLYAGITASNQVIYLGNTTTYSTLALYKTLMSPKEALSVSENPPFLTTNGSAGNFLSINSMISTQVEGQAMAVGGSYTLDYSGTPRHPSTPDIGAWEGSYMPADLLPPSVLSAGFIEPDCNSGGRTYTVNLSDQSGVASGSLSPRLYYRVNLAIYASVPGSLTSGTPTNGVWTFSMAYSAAPGDVIHHFIAVQDISSLNNFTMSPSTGGIASEVNTIVVPPSPVNTFTIGTSPTISVTGGSICSGQSYTLNPSGALSYSYSGGSAVVSPTINTSYSVTGTDAFGCISNIAVANITVNSSPTISVNSGSICTGQSFTFNPTGADAYSFSGGSATVSPLTNATYTVTGTNTLGGCISEPVTTTVNVFTSPTVSANSGTICAGDIFTIVPSGASAYVISGASATVSPLTNTFYLITGTSSEGCASANTATATVTVGPLPTISVNSGSVCSGKSFTIVASGADTYNYSGGSAIVAPLTHTHYTITGASALGCAASNTAIASVTVEASPVITVNSGSMCSGQVFTIVPSDVALTYTYSGGSALVSPGTTTFYTVAGSNSLGCISNTAASHLTVSASPTITVNSGSICSGGIFTIVPSGADAYTISGGSATVSPPTSTFYLVTGSSNAGCASVNTATSAITVAPLPTITVNSGSVCSGKNFTLIASGADAYIYSGGSSIVSPLTNTVYTVTGTSSLGCAASGIATASVTVEASPVITVNSGSICSGQTFTLIPSDGSLTYTYSGGSALVSPGTTTFYTVAGSSSLGCISNIAISNLTVSSSPTISVNSGSICSGKVFTLVPSGAAVYNISRGSATVSPVTSSLYVVSGTNSDGCVSVNTVTATVNVAPLPFITVNSGSVCSGKTFTLAPSGASVYIISGGSPVISPATNTVYSITGTSSLGCISSNTAIATVTVVASPTISVNSGSMCAGKTFTIIPSDLSLTYVYSGGSSLVSPVTTTFFTVSGTNSQGCISNSATANVTVAANPTVSVNSGSICAGNVFTITPSGAATYSVEGGSYAVSPLTTAHYTVTGVSVEGCTAVNMVTAAVTVFTLPSVSVTSGSICSGETFTLTPAGASSYNYSSGTPTVSPVNTSTYAVTGTSSDGCASSNTAVATVSVNNLPPVSIAGSTLICAGETATLTASGADTYTWMSTGNSSVFIVSPGISTTYSVIGASISSCTQAAQITLSVNSLPTVTINGTAAICKGATANLTVTGTAITFTWSDGSTGSLANFSPILTTVYTVTGTSADNCANTATYQVLVNPLPPVQANADELTICAGEPVTLSGSGANTYTWSGGITDNTAFHPTSTAAYTVNGTGAAGCKNSATIEVVVHALPSITITSNSPDTICAGDEITLSAGGANTYSWVSGQVTSSITVSPGSVNGYTVSGTDINGCKAEASFTQFVSECTGIRKYSAALNIHIYPNPGNGLFRIEMDQLHGDEIVEISNTLGAVVYKDKIGSLSSSLELTGWAKGMYVLKIYSGARLLKQEKLILVQ